MRLLSTTFLRVRRLAPAGALLAATAVALAAGPLAADIVTRTDGTVYTGRVLRETPSTVEMEVDKYGATFTMKIPRIQIRSIVRGQAAEPEPEPVTPAPTTGPASTGTDDGGGPVYCCLPIVGRLGGEVPADVFEQALQDALANRPDILVLYVNSAGGAVTEADQITQMLEKVKSGNPKLRIVSYVRRAQAAAAAVALWCPEVFVGPKATIAAAEPPNDDPGVRLDDAANINAKITESAKAGGHAELLVRGLTDPALQLSVATEDGRPVVKEGLAGKPLKDKGKPLVLKGQQAVDCGLAKGVASDVHSMKMFMGIGKWQQVRGKGWALLSQHAAKYRMEMDKARADRRRQASRQKRTELTARVEPELKRIDALVASVQQKGRKAEAEKAKLLQKYNSEKATIENNYTRAVRRLNRDGAQKSHQYPNWVRKARQDRDKALANLDRKHRPAAQKIQAAIDSCLEELRGLVAERKKLLQDTPN